jgi:hypothetical protein
MITTADLISQRLYDILLAAPGRPADLLDAQILDHPDLPVNPSELPVVAVYLVEGDTPSGHQSALSTQRACTVAIEIKVLAEHPLRGTQPFRAWVLAAIEDDETLGGLVDETIYQGFKPFGSVKDGWLAGAILTLEPHYLWRSS